MSTFQLQLHRELQQLFDAFSDTEGTIGEWATRGYAINDLAHKSILFVGLNPCYTDDPQPKDYNIYHLTALEEHPRFFEPYQHVANLCQRGDDWAYTDVFYYRELQQDKLWPVLETPEGRDFIVRQLQFTMRLLDYLKPNLMVVCHPAAHRFFGMADSIQTSDRRMGYQFEFSPAFGVDVITGLHNDTMQNGAKGTSLVGTPVLFCGSLTEMDPSTHKRLAWQMKQILKFHPLFSDIDESGLSNRLSAHITKVTLRIVQLQRAKSELIKKGEYTAAAQQRDRITEIQEELLEVLVKVAGGEEDQ